MIRSWRAMAPNAGYGLTVLATLFLGNIGLLLVTIPTPEAPAIPHLLQIVALAIVVGLAAIFTGLNLNKRHPLGDRSAILWIWLLSLPVSRRLAEMSLAVRWDQSMALEAALLAAAVVLVLMSAGRLAPEEAP
jgi:hypothetical protein